MKKEIETGGPAFPKAGLDPWQKSVTTQTGMSLRDYFAAKAMQGELASPTLSWTGDIEKNISESAYKFADAMLEARK